MDWRWCACFLLVGCFSEPPSSDDGTGSTGPSGSSTTAPMQTSSTGDVDPSSTGAESSSGGLGSTSTGYGSTSTGVGAECPAPTECVPAPPPGWSGPVAVQFAEDLEPDPTCPPLTSELHHGGRNPAAACDCNDCSGESVECDVLLDWGANGFCGAFSEWADCQPFTGTQDGQFWFSISASLNMASECTTPQPSDAQFRTRAVVCEPQAGTCDDGGTCVAGPVCIWQDGEHECPGMFGQPTVLFREVDGEDLSCDSCNCGAGSTFCEDATISVYGDNACGGEPLAVPYEPDLGVCASYQDPESFVLVEDIGSIDISMAPADCSSDVDTALASGSFVESMPFTLCCIP